MLFSRAMLDVGRGLAVIVDGRVRYQEDTRHLGYNTAPGYVKWSGRQSGHAGPTVLQALRRP